MPEISFRPCRPQDADLAVPLIYSSGPAAFDYAFCDSDARQSRDFLCNAFERGDSEFGYRQHTAAILDGKLVGVGAVRYGHQNPAFTFAALKAIFRFYSPLAALHTLTRGLRTEMVIRPPDSDTAVIYHLAVNSGHRGLGIGGRLLQQLQDDIVARRFSTAALDVAASNPRALALYRRCGFVETHRRRGRLVSPFGRVEDHCRMELPLNRGTQRA